MIVTIRPAMIEDVEAIKPFVRQADIDEVWASHYATPESTMQHGITHGDVAYTGLIDGVPIVMWGVIRESLIGNIGCPWMVSTTMADDHATTFLRHCRADTMKVLSKYKTLFNYVDARNTKAIGWLKWLGFTIEEAAPYGVLNKPFHKFHMARHGFDVSVRRCSLAEIKSNRNFPRLAREYASEAKLFGLPPSDEKLAVYTMIEKSGFFHIFGAFEGRMLVGFIALLIPVIPHYGVGVAVAESYFVGKKYRRRGAGLRLLRAAERHADELKTPGIIISLPPESELFQALVKREEYTGGNRALYRKFAHA